MLRLHFSGAPGALLFLISRFEWQFPGGDLSGHCPNAAIPRQYSHRKHASSTESVRVAKVPEIETEVGRVIGASAKSGRVGGNCEGYCEGWEGGMEGANDSQMGMS